MKYRSIIAGLTLAAASSTQAAEISVELTNLTHGSYFTPVFVTSHAAGYDFFEIGVEASDPIKTMAEGGAIADLVTMADGMGASTADAPNSTPMAPGTSVTIENWDTGANTQLSLTTMILPSNDGFVGLNNWTIPTTPGTYTVMLNAYDAGSEANDEIVNGAGALGSPGIPVDPGGNNGSGAMGITDTETNETVHIHRGVIGDTSAEGGYSDLDSRVHRWLNPVARLVVTVQ